jgi:hypothetical protein
MVDKDSQSSFLYSAKHERFDYTVGRNKVVWRCEDVLVLPHMAWYQVVEWNCIYEL